MIPKWARLYILALCALFVLILIVLKHTTTENSVSITTTDRSPLSKHIKPSKLNESKPVDCVFPEIDPWDDEILKFYEPRYDILHNCNRNFTQLTELENGKLIQKDPRYYCWGRCLTRKTEWKNKRGAWTSTKETSFVYTCDIVEAVCSTVNFVYLATYRFIHTQIVERTLHSDQVKHKSTERKKPTGKQYNVYLVIFDSFATTHADRMIPKTLGYFERAMESIPFPYVNKVGANTYPNAITLFFGKQKEKISRAVYNLPDIESEWPDSKCQQFYDNDTFLVKEFAEYGYKTMIADGWREGAVHFPDCIAFEKQPCDHYFRPFVVDFSRHNQEETMSMRNCFEHHQFPLDYLGKFVNSYKDQPKMSCMWAVSLAHEEFNRGIAGDKDIYQFFVKHKKKLDDSFIFFMSDHGLRLGEASSTKVGSIEKNNPMLQISLPKELRQNKKLMETLRENAKKLHTHYDTRATLLDILKYQPYANYSDRSPLQIPGERGQSYLREIVGERSCRSLPIPNHYCICQSKEEKVNTTSSFALQLGKDVVDNLNKRLIDLTISHKCFNWEFKEVLSLSTKKLVDTLQYSVRVKTSSPKEAVLVTTVHYDSKGNFVLGDYVDRQDRYGSDGRCAKLHERICHCNQMGWFLHYWLENTITSLVVLLLLVVVLCAWRKKYTYRKLFNLDAVL